jgi:adenylate kinase
MLNIVLFGPPGAGKGTQAQFLVDNFKLIHLSTGDLLRSQIAQKTKLGMKAQEVMERGELVPDEVVIGMIEAKLPKDKGTNGFIFDGFPRTVAQAEALDELLGHHNTSILGMLSLEVDKQELIDRLLERGKTSGRPDDADVSVIENRINVYNQKTSPLIDFYKDQGKYFPIKGMGTIDEIAERLKTVVEGFSN